MRTHLLIGSAFVLVCGSSFGIAIAADAPGLLKLVQTIPLPDVEGRIDHFALDAKSQRLFMAGLGNNTVEVIGLGQGRIIGRIAGLATPQGVGFDPTSNRLAVANDHDGSVRLYDGTTLKHLATVDLKDDADNIRCDATNKLFWVGYGDGGLAAIDTQSASKTADIVLDAHPESFQLESKGDRIFVNVPKKGHVAVVDRKQRRIVAKWRLTEASANYPMALDEAGGRLFIGCRKPAKLLVLNSQTGKTVQTLDIVGDTDDVFYDAARKRIYVSGGEGYVTVIQQSGADNYSVIGRVDTAPGARTSFFVPSSGTLCVAVPHRGSQKTEVRLLRAE